MTDWTAADLTQNKYVSKVLKRVKKLEDHLVVLLDTFKKNDLLARMDKYEQEAIKNDLLNRVAALEAAAKKD